MYIKNKISLEEFRRKKKPAKSSKTNKTGYENVDLNMELPYKEGFYILPFKAPSVNQMYGNSVKGRKKTVKAVEFKKIASIFLKRQHKGKILTGNIKLDINLYFKGNRKTDIDNFNKAILDSMSGIVYKDDSQIIELNLKKYMGCDSDEVEITVQEV